MNNSTNNKKINVFFEQNKAGQALKIGVTAIVLLAGVLIVFKLGKEILKEMEGMGL